MILTYHDIYCSPGGVGLNLILSQVLPDAVTWIGAAVIIASGLYLMRREGLTLRRRPERRRLRPDGHD